jgi:uncharacterized protein (TIRG00374 family)
MKEPNNMRRFAKGTAGAIILSTFAAFIILQVTARGETRLSLLRLDLSQLALAGILVGAGWILDAVRIKVLASTLGGGIGFFTALRITLAGAFAACVTPFDTGGEPLQVYLLHKHGFNPGESTAIVALKSLISAVARLFLVLLIPTWYLVRRRTWTLPKGLETALFIGLSVYIFFFGLLLFFAVYPEYIRIIMDKVLNNRLMARFISKSTATTVMEHVEKGVSDFRSALSTFLREQRSVLILISLLSLVAGLSGASRRGSASPIRKPLKGARFPARQAPGLPLQLSPLPRRPWQGQAKMRTREKGYHRDCVPA